MKIEPTDLVAARLAVDEAFNELLAFERERSGVKPEPPLCSFCGRGANEVARMLSGFGDAYICSECVMLAQQIITQE